MIFTDYISQRIFIRSF